MMKPLKTALLGTMLLGSLLAFTPSVAADDPCAPTANCDPDPGNLTCRQPGGAIRQAICCVASDKGPLRWTECW